MKLYYKYDKYDCKIKSELDKFLKKDQWSNFEPIKITMTMPLSKYTNMLSDINECDKEFHFKLLMNDKDKHNCGSFGETGLWSIDSRLNGPVLWRSCPGVFRISLPLCLPPDPWLIER